MADMYFKESCPCGTNVDMSGYVSEVKAQVIAWRSIHKRHADALLKATIADINKKVYPSYIWPVTTGTSTSTFNSEVPIVGGATEK